MKDRNILRLGSSVVAAAILGSTASCFAQNEFNIENNSTYLITGLSRIKGLSVPGKIKTREDLEKINSTNIKKVIPRATGINPTVAVVLVATFAIIGASAGFALARVFDY